MENILKLLFMGIAVLVLAYFLFFSRKGLTIFELHFKNGKLDRHRGKVPTKFEREAKALAKKNKLTGYIRAEKNNGVRLHVSATISDNCAQQLRNMFPFELYDKKEIDNTKQRG